MRQNHLFPFLWITGENTSGIVEEIAAIYESGARGFCVESRTCEDFCGEKWFEIMNKVLAEAKTRDMQVWLLDDKHYPTGFANGAIEKKYPGLRPYRIKCDFVDVEGEAGEASILLNSVSDTVNEDEIIGVFAVKTNGNKARILSDLTRNVTGDRLVFDYDGKPIRICTLKKTRSGAEYADRPFYIDMLNPNSVNVLIREVYEPHYSRYVKNGDYRGTFCGFFSDEPRFGNGFSVENPMCEFNAYKNTLGIFGMTYPWSENLSRKFSPHDLLSLWYDTGDNTSEIRTAYMNEITSAYGENFSGRLSAWCHERGLTYCGHIVEDMGAHTRLGCSAGHYFRSQTGADYAAVDVVLHQIKPYYEKPHFAPIAGGYADPMFFDGTLAKLASSCARLYEEKQGRSLCEIFGAYGWGESINEMLYLVNHMLVRGINAFIPHAYSQAFPNDDCPPHFGKSASLFGGYKLIMRYMKKMCELFETERADIKTAVLYHAEAEWSGGKYMPVDTVAVALMQRQIDFDILPADKLDCADRYEYLIVPYAERLSAEALRKISLVKSAKILNLKSNSSRELAAVANALPRTVNLFGKGSRHIRAMKFAGKEKYFLHNEGSKAVNLRVCLCADSCKIINLLCDTEDIRAVKDGKANLCLRPGQAVIIEGSAATANKRASIMPLDFKKIFEDDEAIIYEISARFENGDKLRFEYTGEWARVRIENREYDSIGGFASVAVQEFGEKRIVITIYKNIAERVRDELSKFDIFRPSRLKNIGIKR